MRVWRPQPTFEEAIKAAQGLVEPNQIILNEEYARGQLELLIDLYAVDQGMDAKQDVADLLGWPSEGLI